MFTFDLFFLFGICTKCHSISIAVSPYPTSLWIARARKMKLFPFASHWLSQCYSATVEEGFYRASLCAGSFAYLCFFSLYPFPCASVRGVLPRRICCAQRGERGLIALSLFLLALFDPFGACIHFFRVLFLLLDLCVIMKLFLFCLFLCLFYWVLYGFILG